LVPGLNRLNARNTTSSGRRRNCARASSRSLGEGRFTSTSTPLGITAAASGNAGAPGSRAAQSVHTSRNSRSAARDLNTNPSDARTARLASATSRLSHCAPACVVPTLQITGAQS
jgi:hypothetical protein